MALVYHNFEKSDTESLYWTHVKPGDLVRSPGIHAIRSKDFKAYCEGTEQQRKRASMLTLANGLLLVLSKIDGCPGVSDWDHLTTFTVLSRHGVLILLQAKRK